MSRYRLRGRVGISDEPDPYSLAYEPASLSTDFHWEVGYDPARVMYFAELYDDNPDDDTDFPIEPGASELMKAIGEGSSVDTIEQLQAGMDVSLPPGVAAALRGGEGAGLRRAAGRARRPSASPLAPAARSRAEAPSSVQQPVPRASENE